MRLKNTLANIELTTSQLEQFISENKNLITDEDKENLHSLLSNINSISFNLDKLINEESDNIKQSIQNFNNSMDKIPSISKNLDEVLNDLSNIVENVNSGKGTVSRLINEEALYDNVNGLVLDARCLLSDVKENPAKYLRAWFEAKKK